MDLTKAGITIDKQGTLDPEDYADEADAKAREARGDFKGFYSDTVDTTFTADINAARGQSGAASEMRDFLKSMTMSKAGGPNKSNYDPVEIANLYVKENGGYASDYFTDDPSMSNEDLLKLMDHEQARWALGRRFELDPNEKNAMDFITAQERGMMKSDGTWFHGNAVGTGPMQLGGPTDEQKAAAIDVEFPLARTTFDPSANQDWYKAVEGWFDGLDATIAEGEKLGINQGGSKAVAWMARTFVGEPLRALRELQDADLTRTPSDSPTGAETVSAVGSVALNTGVLSTVAPAPKGALRVFGGTDAAENLAKAGMPQAQTAIEIATMLEKKGVSEAKIREVTRSLADEGGFGNISKAADGQWVVELPANKLEITDFDKIKTKGAQYLDEVVKFDELFKAMPEAKDVKVIVQKVNPNMKNFRPSGSFTAPDEIRIVARHAEDVRDVIVHEIEHYAQSYRKGAYGANNDIEGDFAYTHSAGELQANSSQIRQEMTAQELSEIHPRIHEQTTDGKIVPRSEQIVRTREEWETGRRAASQSSGGFYGDKKMTAKDISTEERKLATSLRSNTVRKESLERDLKDASRWNASELERKQAALAKHQDRIDELTARLTEVSDIKAARSMMPSRVNDVRETAVTPLTQGIPKNLSEDVGSMPKRRSKLERLKEDKESLETVLTLETRLPRLERAKKHLKKVESDLDKITSGE